MGQWEIRGCFLASFIAMAQIASGQQDPYCDPVAGWDLEPCFCSSGILDCSNVTSGDQLLVIPGLQNGESMPFIRIQLKDNDQIFAIPDGAFGNHYAVLAYDFQNNRNLSKIGPTIISPLSALTLTEILLSGNSLESFPFESIKNFQSLAVIDLRNNNLQEIPTRAFADSNSTISSLFFTANNITSIGADAFTGLRDLEEIILTDNRLGRISSDWFKFDARPDIALLVVAGIWTLEEGDYLNFPLITDLKGNGFGYDNTLEQSAWEPILDDLLQVGGHINLDAHYQCDCLLEWLYNRPEFAPVLYSSVLCVSANHPPSPLWSLDPEMFENC